MARGGKREGAGRKPTGEPRLVAVTVRLPAEYVAWARERSLHGNVSEGLRQLLDELDQLQGAARADGDLR